MANSKKHAAKHLKPKNHAALTLVSLALFVITMNIAGRGNFTGWELSVFKQIYNWPDSLKPIFLIITQFGSAWMVLVIFFIAFATKIKGLALKILLNGAITYLAVEYFKIIIGRPRPDEFYAWVLPRQPNAYGNGFPSGHSAIATVLALTVMPYLPKKYYWLVPLWIAAVGLSRIYLGVHAPLDVIGGVALGLVIASFQHLWTAKSRLKRSSRRHRLKMEV